ncbi:hypothetical protein QTP86_000868 [Hemibagrus guttatus]|nr:hypothetical protein QTP86_000868 [Hemibagrus guttatus]
MEDKAELRKSAFCGTNTLSPSSGHPDGWNYNTWQELLDVAGLAPGTPPEAEDYPQAEVHILKRVQQESFPEDYKLLRMGKSVSSRSRLVTLAPEMDLSSGLIRVGGCLRRVAGIEDSVLHPVVLDPNHPVTRLIIHYYYHQLHHSGSERLFAEIRRYYWILRGREAVRRFQHDCPECQRWRAQPTIPKMVDLPSACLRLHKPAFHSCGVDCFGPMLVKIGRRTEKRWGILFKCLTTRAVHLDLLPSMSTDSFLMALRRFVARRGTPAELWSDQGTNFRGGERELREAYAALIPNLQRQLARQKIHFHFNPPSAPHFGGVWEREVRSVKSALYTVLGSQSVPEEVLITVLLEVEAILNSKPLGNLNNTRTLFATVERLTNPPSQIPSEMLSNSKCNEFASFFSEKIINIRKAISTSSSNAELLISSSSSSYTFIPVSPTQLHTLETPHPPALAPLTIKEEGVNRLFKRLNTRKATGLDSVSPSLLKHCANQLSPVFTDIFNTSLETCHVSACFKTSAIVPVPKKTKITGLNDYRPVALTSVDMKSFERLVLSYLKDITDPLLDLLQFAYRANSSVDDAVNMAFHFILQHLDSPGSYARILFVDFSSAFNTIIPALLRDNLFQLNVPDYMYSWITDFLTDRWQFVRLGMHVSDLQHISTGSPQGCVLSPLLFSLYTNGCISGHQSVKLLKFADDITLIGLISDGDESAYRGEMDRLVSWCSMNNLELNSLKTVEMIVDFRKEPAPLPPSSSVTLR